uniref:Uncharacterized protein n=1 Tax=Arcella intermedia TaxID=1963864 RepID=A0A6B2L9V0_9EUKA
MTFLGTSSAKPTRERNVTAMCLQTDHWAWMFDCGEATQHQILKHKIRRTKLEKIFLTHLHGDHVYGLPGLICELSWGGQSGSGSRIDLYGPVGLRALIRTTAAITAPGWMQDFINVHELGWKQIDTTWQVPTVKDDKDYSLSHSSLIYEDERYEVRAVPIYHTVPCVGYVIIEKSQPGTLLVEKLQEELKIPPGPIYAQIKSGKCTEIHGIKTDRYVAPPKPSKKIVILGDTYRPDPIIGVGRNCDLLVHEATFSHDQVDMAIEKGHSTAKMAGQFATKIGTKHLMITHFSAKTSSDQHETEKITTDDLQKEAQSEFLGPVTVANDFDTIEI